MPGHVVILNGAPRAGKSSIARAMQERLDGTWMSLGVDVARQTTPPHLQPGIGLRPGEPDHPAASSVPVLYAALYESVAAHSRLGLNVVVDVAHHDETILADARRRLTGLPVLFVGVRCPVSVIEERRAATGTPTGQAARWEDAVHRWTYDLEVDTSTLTPAECADAIAARLS